MRASKASWYSHPTARQGSMWFGWPSTAHQLHSLPLKFMKPSSSLPPPHLVILRVRDFYYWNETFMTVSPRRTRVASWIISTQLKEEEKWDLADYWSTPPVLPRSSQNANFHEYRNNLTCIELKFTKITIRGIYERKLAGGIERFVSSEAGEVGVE